MTLKRYVPTIALIIWVLLLVSGVPPEVLRIPGLLTLAITLAVAAPAEANSVRAERRKLDRRHDDTPS